LFGILIANDLFNVTSESLQLKDNIKEPNKITKSLVTQLFEDSSPSEANHHFVSDKKYGYQLLIIYADFQNIYSSQGKEVYSVDHIINIVIDELLLDSSCKYFKFSFPHISSIILYLCISFV